MFLLKDYWKAGVGMQKEGTVNTILECGKVSNIAPFGRGSDGRHHKPLTQLSVTVSWIVPTQGIICLPESHYRMSLETVGQSLTGFASSREFISTIADAMEAHDDAYFAARILHRDISVGNILFTDKRKGMLIDWDLCANLNTDTVVARRPSRTGTWQFMSAMLQDRPNRPHQIQDDRESAFHVLLWIALRYTESNVHDTPLLGSDLTASETIDTIPHNDVINLMRAYDEAYVDGSGAIRGGLVKQALFTSDVLSRLEFSGRPELNALVEEFVETFKVRYEKSPTPSDFASLKRQEAFIAKYPDIPDRDDLILNLGSFIAYKYQTRLDQLGARHWVVDTIRKHLTANWPRDKAIAQQVVAQIGSKRKTMLHQANLEERPAKRQSSASNHVT
ncbi:hypothetical protein BJ912DRAFT_1060958 [Pholiota molesta]|nr:hypothetical protein BJ912DRAFT_1060958 [Pholiota molesta]